MKYKAIILVIAAYVFLNLIMPNIAKGLSIYFFTIACWAAVAFTILIIGIKQEKLNLFKWRLNNSIILNAAMIGALQIAALIFVGFFTAFGKSPYAFTPMATTINIAYFLFPLIASELARASIMKSCPKKRIFIGISLTAIFFTFISFPLRKFIASTTNVEIVEFIGSSFIPTLAQNLLATYLVLISGPSASIAYLGTLQAFEWLSPILPNPTWPIKALVNTLIPIVGFLAINQTVSPHRLMLFGLTTRTEAFRKLRKTGKFSTLSWIAIALISLIAIWSTTGLLGFTPTVIASGSMQPTLNLGDIVIVVSTPAKSIKVGDIIQYQTASGVPTVHRVIDKYTQGGQLWFITKGDANKAPDDPINERQVIGKVILTIPKLGWISIYLKEFAANTYTFLSTTLPTVIAEGSQLIATKAVYITAALALTAYTYLLFTYRKISKKEEINEK